MYGETLSMEVCVVEVRAIRMYMGRLELLPEESSLFDIVEEKAAPEKRGKPGTEGK